MGTLMRNLLNVYCRYKWATALNLLGLSLAFTVFYVVARQAWFEFGFNRSLSDHEKIYRFEQVSATDCSAVFLWPLLSQVFQDSPYIEKAGMQICYSENCVVSSPRFPDNLYSETVEFIDRGYTEVFDFKWVEGGISGFNVAERNVLIPYSLAKKIFQGGDAIGKVILLEDVGWSRTKNNYTVVGVYQDFQANTSVSNCIYCSMEKEDTGNWENGKYYGFIKVSSPDRLDDILQAIKYPEGYFEHWAFANGKDFKVRLFPVDDVYFYSQTRTSFLDESLRNGNLRTTYFLLGVAVLILIIAAINFINFSMALAPVRIKSVNTQKVLGASVASLRGSILVEGVVLSFLAFFISLIEIQLLSRSYLAQLFIVDISLWEGGVALAGSAVISLLLGVLAGLWPAFYVTSVSPVLALKGSFHLSPKGVRLRNLLIGFQFAVVLGLLTIALFFFLQNRYMLSLPLGFDTDRIVTVDHSSYRQSEEQADVLISRLKAYSGTEEVFASDGLLLNKDNGYQGFGVPGFDGYCRGLEVQPGFLRGMEIKVTEGRGFVKGEVGKVVVNESARKTFKFKLGDVYRGYEIVGFIPDLKVFSLHKVSSIPFALFSGDRKRVFYVKLKAGADEKEAVEYCRKLADAHTPVSGIIPVRLLNDLAQDLYQKERDQFRIISLFCGLTMFIAVMGVFGLVIFETQSRRKEVGIRKISGASSGRIVWLFIRSYLFVVFISFILSVPIAWYIVRRWMEAFVDHIPVYCWVFLSAFGIVALITAATVIFQCWHIANANPVKSIKNE